MFRLSLIALAGLLILKCAADPLAEVVGGNTKFTADVYKKLIQTKNGNIILSGLSAEIILSLLTSGAKGQTQQELVNALNLPAKQKDRDDAFSQITTSLNINTDDLKLLSANKLYPDVKFTIAGKFNQTAVQVYKSDVESIDYTNPQAASETINSWVAGRTNNKIQNLIDSKNLGPDTVLVLVNALYLLAKWQQPFEKHNTMKRPFYTSQTSSKSIDTMYTEKHVKYSHCSAMKAKFLELDFQGDKVSMVFVLPDERTGLSAVEENIEQYLAPQNYDNAYVAITLPKFQINTDIDFTKILQQLGVTTAFSNSADLSGISKNLGLKVSFVVQKAFINVTESGVEAAAATGVGVSKLSLPSKPELSFKADHPFIYYITDKSSGIVLFAGRFNGFD
ncbi:unnamed protein product [Phyllotreta striolata]|uniref:Serpin domain-containing protein n=1 Tax=Phyllotreta striolata TaxID=444603 RepID=A0A9N9TTI1_PHYSR|nr:unnamed protein product [Phyllotreta striolata]